MREDNGVFRDLINYRIKIAEMSIVLADYLQHKACARHGPAHLPRQLLAELLQPPCFRFAQTAPTGPPIGQRVPVQRSG